MTSIWSFAVLHYDKSNGPWTVQDITEAVDGIPLFTDTGSGQVNTARIILDANLGHYTRDQRGGESGFPTKIDHRDRIRIIVLDGSGIAGQVYDKVFEVAKKVPTKSKAGGTQLQIDLIGIERYLQTTNYAKPHYFTLPNEVFEDIIKSYNAQQKIAVNMPIASGHLVTDSTNQLPAEEGQIHHFDFGISEDTHYNRIMDVVDKQGSSGDNGGVLDFFDFFVTYSLANVTSFVTNVVSAGSPSAGSEVVLDTSIDGEVNTGDNEGGIEEEKGTVVHAWGSNDAGTLPIDYSRFKSRQILMPTKIGVDSLFPEFKLGPVYKAGAIVTSGNIIFQADVDTGIGPPTGWTNITPEDYYGGIQYSPWTDDKVAFFKNSGADPADQFTGNYGPAMWDANIIVNDDQSFRTWADVKTTDPSFINHFWLYRANLSGIYEGLRVLVDGVGTGDFAGHNFTIMEFHEGSWREKYDPVSIGKSMMVTVFDEGRVYIWDQPNIGQWNNLTLSDNGSDCLHPYISITNSESVIVDADTGNDFLTTNKDSAIRVRYEWSPLGTWLQQFFNQRTFAEYYRAGAWLCLRIPYPINTYNGIGEGVGDLYGGGTNTDNPNAPASIDTQNMHLSHDGKRGFNQGLSSEDYGPLSALDFFMKAHYVNIGNPLAPLDVLKGNFKMRCFMFDASDHVVYQDFVLSHNDNWQSVSLPLKGFSIYRGRRPRYDEVVLGFSLNDIVPPKGLDANEQFEWRHVRMICWQTEESYDDSGRYHGGRGDFGTLNLFGNKRRLDLYLDGLRWKKPLLVNTGSSTDIEVEPDFLQRTDIFIYDQLKSDVFSELEKFQFKNTKYNVSTTGRFDIPFTNFFFLKDNEIIDETDGGVDNQVKLVAKHIEYSITEVNDNEGGFKRKILGARRFI